MLLGYIQPLFCQVRLSGKKKKIRVLERKREKEGKENEGKWKMMK